MKQREKQSDSPPRIWNPSKRSETIATTPRNLIEERNLVAISGKEKETTPFKFARLADISDRGNGIQRVAKSRRRWGRNELAGRLIILTAQEFVCVAGHSIILTAANPSRNIVQWTRPLLILSLFLDEWSTTGIKKGRKRGDGRVPKNRLIMESSDPRERWEGKAGYVSGVSRDWNRWRSTFWGYASFYTSPSFMKRYSMLCLFASLKVSFFLAPFSKILNWRYNFWNWEYFIYM